MNAPKLADIEADYSAKFAECKLSVEHIADATLNSKGRAARLTMLRDEIGWSVRHIGDNQARYQDVANRFGNALPWFVIALIHAMEGSLDFKTHLANGDSLQRRTVNAPAGLPRSGKPPFSWEEGARAALLEDRLDKVTRWDLPGILYVLEGFNGWGTRAKGVATPYLWSGTQFYTAGKYVADHQWSATAMSQQLGAALLLRELVNRHLVSLRATPVPAPAPHETILANE